MDIQPNFEYLCRVCAANTKGKHSVAECVYILKTPSLKDKIEKYLYLTVSENDPLPKVLCKTCFRQVEATASLSKIAKHTQKVFRDFMLCSKSITARNEFNIDIEPNPNAINDAPSTTPILNSVTPEEAAAARAYELQQQQLQQQQHHLMQQLQQQQHLQQQNLHQQQKQLQQQQKQLQQQQQQQKQLQQQQPQQQQQQRDREVNPHFKQPPPAAARKDEVVVNVSITDPLTRENSHKLMHAAQKRHNSLDSKFTPKSIAQRAFTSTPKESVSTSSIASPLLSTSTSPKKSSPAGVINFIQSQIAQPPTTTPPQTPQIQSPPQQQVTALTTGGNVIGHVAMPTASSTPVQPSSQVLQQKRRNLKMALNNIRASALANSTGQISLLKSSQKQPKVASVSASEAEATETQAKEVAAAPVSATQPISKPTPSAPPAENVPKAPSKKTNTPPQKVPTPPTKPPTPEKPTTPEKSAQQAPMAPPQPQPQPIAVNATGIPDDIVLGRVIRDADLLKLILKALKWPVTKQTLDIQIQRLKNSKFMDIMSDSNLLQDMDLTQILGPYLAPVLMAAQAIQQQQMAMAAAAAAKNATALPTSTTEAQAIASAMPYKLPAETSVQLISVNAEEEATEPKTVSAPVKKSSKRDIRAKAGAGAATKKPRKNASQKGRGEAFVINISDEDEMGEENEHQNETNAGRVASAFKVPSAVDVPPNFCVDIDPAFLTQFALMGGGASSEETPSEALLALLNRQQLALARLQSGQSRRRRSNPSSNPPFNLEDFVLIEPPSTSQLEDEEPPSLASSVNSATSNKSGLSLTRHMGLTLPLMQPTQPVITRPIIKRRKTVIQVSPAAKTVIEPTTPLAVAPTASAPSIVSQAASTTTASTTAPLDQPSISTIGAPTTAAKVSASSICPQVPVTEKLPLVATVSQMPSTEHKLISKSTSNDSLEVKSTAADAAAKATSYTTKKSHPSKSALGQQLLEAIGLQKVQNAKLQASVKRHLQQQVQQAVQKQQQQKVGRKLEEPTVADADSTTKSVVKEVLVEAKNKNAHSTNADVDLEEQIDKIALVVTPGSGVGGEDSATATGAIPKAINDAIVQGAKKIGAPITKRRSTLSGRGRKKSIPAVLNAPEQLNTIVEAKEESETESKKDSTFIEVTDDDYDSADDEAFLISDNLSQLRSTLVGITADDKEALEKIGQQNTSATSTSIDNSAQNISSSELNVPKEASLNSRKRSRKRNEDNDPDFVEPVSRSKDHSMNADVSPQRERAGRSSRAAAILAKQQLREMENDDLSASNADRLAKERLAREKAAAEVAMKQLREMDSEPKTKLPVPNNSSSSSSSGRPTRASKSQSKYFKGPDKTTKSKRGVSRGRVTRNRK